MNKFCQNGFVFWLRSPGTPYERFELNSNVFLETGIVSSLDVINDLRLRLNELQRWCSNLYVVVDKEVTLIEGFMPILEEILEPDHILVGAENVQTAGVKAFQKIQDVSS